MILGMDGDLFDFTHYWLGVIYNVLIQIDISRMDYNGDKRWSRLDIPGWSWLICDVVLYSVDFHSMLVLLIPKQYIHVWQTAYVYRMSFAWNQMLITKLRMNLLEPNMSVNNYRKNCESYFFAKKTFRKYVQCVPVHIPSVTSYLWILCNRANLLICVPGKYIYLSFCLSKVSQLTKPSVNWPPLYVAR